MKELFKKTPLYLGIVIALSGVVVLLLCMFTEMKNHNTALFLGLLLIILGIVVYVLRMKCVDRY